MKEETSKWWWIKSHNTSDSSPWLNSTLSDLDAKTKEILKVIDEVDDETVSLVKRAKFHYEKKPKLVAMVEDLYRSHQSLAHKYDALLLKNSSVNPSRHNSSTCDELSELCEEKAESEVDDCEEGQVVEVGDNGGEENRVYKEMMIRQKREEVSWLGLVSVCFVCFHFSWDLFCSLLLRFC